MIIFHNILTKMKCFYLFITITITYTELQGANCKTKEDGDYLGKRLLIDDPSVIMKEIGDLQHRLQQQQGQIAEIVAENSALKAQLQSQGKGVVYTRWGKKHCGGNGTEDVYSGYVGGPWFNSHGSGSNPVCLSPDPIWGHYNDNLDTHAAYIYGAEYELVDNLQHLYNENVPCAVCLNPIAVTTLMIPGRNKCYPGWNEEYHGYLVANRGEYLSGLQYTCLDDSPDVLDSGHANQDGVLFVEVEGRCGSLPCPPYVNGREITCVVCSR